MQALIGGSADVVAGAFDHTIQMQAKGQPIVGVVELGRFPGFVLGVLDRQGAAYRGPADLKGMKIGITAPGSSTHFMVRYLMAQAGLKDDDASFIGIGAGPTAVAAARRGEIDALVNVDPVISLLESEKAIKVVADTRTLEGTRQVFGGAYPAAVLYVTPAYIADQRRDRAGADQRLRARAAMDRDAIRRGDRQGDAGRICARRQGQLRALDQKQHADVLAGRPVRRRRARGRAEGAARIRSRTCRRPSIDLAATYTDAFVDKAPGNASSMSTEPQIAIDKVAHVYRPPRGRPVLALDDISLEVAAARIPGAARPVRLRQVHAALSDRRLPADREGHDHASTASR